MDKRGPPTFALIPQQNETRTGNIFSYTRSTLFKKDRACGNKSYAEGNREDRLSGLN